MIHAAESCQAPAKSRGTTAPCSTAARASCTLRTCAAIKRGTHLERDCRSLRDGIPEDAAADCREGNALHALLHISNIS